MPRTVRESTRRARRHDWRSKGVSHREGWLQESRLGQGGQPRRVGQNIASATELLQQRRSPLDIVDELLLPLCQLVLVLLLLHQLVAWSRLHYPKGHAAPNRTTPQE